MSHSQPGTTGSPPGLEPVATGFFASSDEFFVAPDQIEVGRVVAIDLDGDDFHFSLVGGRDRAFMTIDPDTGDLRFKTHPPGNVDFPRARSSPHTPSRLSSGLRTARTCPSTRN